MKIYNRQDSKKQYTTDWIMKGAIYRKSDNENRNIQNSE